MLAYPMRSKGVFHNLPAGITEIGTTFTQGDWKTRISYVIFGFGPICRGQILKGAMFLASEMAFAVYMVNFGWKYLSKFTTLGTVATQKINRKTVYGDNSFLILLFGLLTIVLIAGMVLIWRMNIAENRREEEMLKAGKDLPSNRSFAASFLDGNFDKTLLALPCAGIFVFTVLPILFMICVAFTNYDKNHQSPTNLFTWVGLENFRKTGYDDCRSTVCFTPLCHENVRERRPRQRIPHEVEGDRQSDPVLDKSGTCKGDDHSGQHLDRNSLHDAGCDRPFDEHSGRLV